MNLKFKKMYSFRETTRKTISSLHLTQTILKAEKNSLICIKTKAYRNLKFRKKNSFMEKTRETISVLHFTQNIQKAEKNSMYCS